MIKPEMMPLYIDSFAGDREALVGDDGFEVPKRPRTAAQIAAFENLAKKVGKSPPLNLHRNPRLRQLPNPWRRLI